MIGKTMEERKPGPEPRGPARASVLRTALLLASTIALSQVSAPCYASPQAAPPAKPKTSRKPGPAPTPAPTPGPRPGFEVEIEQSGKKITIENHRARIARGPFVLVIDASAGAWPYLHASYESRVFDAAAQGRSLGQTFKSVYVLAEAAGLHDLTIGAGHTVHYLADGQDVRRFDEVKKVGSRFRARRTVSSLTRDGGMEPIETTEEPVLHLVLVRGPSNAKTFEVADEQREYLALELGHSPPGFERDLEDNPEYEAWASFQKGSWVEWQKMIGGLLIYEKLNLKTVTEREVVLDKQTVVFQRQTGGIQRVFSKRRRGFAERTTDTPATLKIRGKTLSCTRRSGETMDTWNCADVPGGRARRELRNKRTGPELSQEFVHVFKAKKR
jgi:hypothetical protein